MNWELHSPTDLTEHDALTAHEADDHLEHEPALAKDVAKHTSVRTKSGRKTKPTQREDSVYFVLLTFKAFELTEFSFSLVSTQS